MWVNYIENKEIDNFTVRIHMHKYWEMCKLLFVGEDNDVVYNVCCDRRYSPNDYIIEEPFKQSGWKFVAKLINKPENTGEYIL